MGGYERELIVICVKCKRGGVYINPSTGLCKLCETQPLCIAYGRLAFALFLLEAGKDPLEALDTDPSLLPFVQTTNIPIFFQLINSLKEKYAGRRAEAIELAFGLEGKQISIKTIARQWPPATETDIERIIITFLHDIIWSAEDLMSQIHFLAPYC